jgi:hypothetical protein
MERELKSFVKQFPEFRVRYEHSEDDYFVEITPGKIYFQSDDYMQWGCDICDRFDDRFPGQGLCFISENDLFSLEKIDFTVYGKKYAADHNLVCDEDKNWFAEALEGIFDRHKQRKRKHETA